MCTETRCGGQGVRGRVPVAAGVLVEAASAGEDYDGDVDVTEDGELPGLLDEAIPAFRERHLPAALVLDPPKLDLAAPRLPPGGSVFCFRPGSGAGVRRGA